MNRRGFLKCMVAGVTALAVPKAVLANSIQNLKPVYAVVDINGNDRRGVSSTVLSEAKPYSTIGGALESGATTIYVTRGEE